MPYSTPNMCHSPQFWAKSAWSGETRHHAGADAELWSSLPGLIIWPSGPWTDFAHITAHERTQKFWYVPHAPPSRPHYTHVREGGVWAAPVMNSASASLASIPLSGRGCPLIPLFAVEPSCWIDPTTQWGWANGSQWANCGSIRISCGSWLSSDNLLLTIRSSQ